MDKLCSEPNHTIVENTALIFVCLQYSYFHLNPFVFAFTFVCLDYFLLSPEPIEAIFRPIHSENWRPGVSLRYPPVSLKNNHLEYKHNYHLVVGQDSFDRTGETGPVYNKKIGSRILSFLIIAGIGTLIFHFHCFPSPQTFVYFHFRAICLKISFTRTGRINFMISIDSIKLLEECLLNI